MGTNHNRTKGRSAWSLPWVRSFPSKKPFLPLSLPFIGSFHGSPPILPPIGPSVCLLPHSHPHPHPHPHPRSLPAPPPSPSPPPPPDCTYHPHPHLLPSPAHTPGLFLPHPTPILLPIGPTQCSPHGECSPHGVPRPVPPMHRPMIPSQASLPALVLSPCTGPSKRAAVTRRPTKMGGDHKGAHDHSGADWREDKRTQGMPLWGGEILDRSPHQKGWEGATCCLGVVGTYCREKGMRAGVKGGYLLLGWGVACWVDGGYLLPGRGGGGGIRSESTWKRPPSFGRWRTI